MTEAEARDLLTQMVDAAGDPALDTTEITLLLNQAKRADADDLPPSDPLWTPTWDLNAAAVEGWRWKAAKAASRVTIHTEGQTINRSDYVKHCRGMAAMYQRRVFSWIAR